MGRVPSQSLVGMVLLSFSGGGGRYIWVFPLPGRELPSDPRERAHLGRWWRYL